ncbi:hypothetical protein ACOME3_001920 [Neoechinorhynchus agilis]
MPTRKVRLRDREYVARRTWTVYRYLCHNSFCSLNHSTRKNTVPYTKTFMKSCLTSVQCSRLKKLECRSYICQCIVNHRWNGTKCERVQKSFMESCTKTSQCKSQAGLECSSFMCQCSASRRWDGTKCKGGHILRF